MKPDIPPIKITRDTCNFGGNNIIYEGVKDAAPPMLKKISKNYDGRHVFLPHSYLL
jgi:hypothetical protein